MEETAKTSDTSSPPRRRRRRRRSVLIVMAVLIVGFYCFVMFRGPRDYRGELARLLPARTSAYVALNDFNGIRKRMGETRLYGQLRASVDLAALLMTSEDWRKYQEDKNSVEGKAKAALAREFLRRYFSDQVAVALAHLDDCDEPALLVLARTGLGFSEKLAELCAELYPDLQLSTQPYRGIPIYVYDAPEAKRAFTFVRFGKTVVLSLRSDERDYLRRIIDYRLDGPAKTLFETEAFQRAWKSPARRQGLFAVGRPLDVLDDLVARPDFGVRKSLSKSGKARLQRTLGAFRSIEAALTVGEKSELRLSARNDGATSLVVTPPPTEPLTLLNSIPTSAVACAVFRFGNLAETLARILNIHRAFAAESDDPKVLAAAVERLNSAWGLDINRELAPALGTEIALVVHDMQEISLLLSVADRRRAETVVGKLIEDYADYYADPKQAWKVPESFRDVPEFQPLYSAPLGFLGIGWVGDNCLLGLNPGAYLAMKQMLERKGRPIGSNPVFQLLDLPVDKPLDAVAFINLEEIGRRAENLLALLSLTSKSVRRRSAKYGKIVGVVKLLRGVGLYITHTDEEWTVVLRVPTQ